MHYIHFTILIVLFNTALTQVANDNEDVVVYPCEDDNFCKAELPGSKCIQNTCQCVSAEGCGREESSIAVRKIGLSCKTSADCLIDYSECSLNGNETVCSCMKNTVASKNKKSCLKLSVGLNKTCKETVQCSNFINSECRKGVCKCIVGTKAHGGTCYFEKALGDSCQINEDCISIENSECFGNKCVCSKYFVKGKAGCLLAAEGFDSPCLEDEQCRWNLGDGAMCYENKCTCQDLFLYKMEARRCVQHIMLSKNCTKDADCHTRHEVGVYMECVSNVCECKSPYKEFEDDCIEGMASTVKYILPVILATLLFLYLF